MMRLHVALLALILAVSFGGGGPAMAQLGLGDAITQAAGDGSDAQDGEGDSEGGESGTATEDSAERRSPVQSLPPGAVAGASSADEAMNAQHRAWSEVAGRAVERIGSGTASPYVLRQLRGELVTWRDRFLAAQGSNAGRISTVQAQLNALGPKPGEGVEEDPSLAARRGELQERLASLRAPGLLAAERYTEASGLISEIDAIQRARDANRLTNRGPSPLNPAVWGDASFAFFDEITRIGEEIVSSFSGKARSGAARGNITLSIIFTILAVMLLWRGPYMVRRALRWLASGARRSVLRPVVSLGQILLPLLGLIFLNIVFVLLDVFGARVQELMTYMPQLGMTVLVAHWLACQLFEDEQEGLLELVPSRRARARWATIALGWAIAASDLLRAVMETSPGTSDTIGVILFPVHLLVAWLLYELGRDLKAVEPVSEEGEDEPEPMPFRQRIVSWCGLVARIAAVVGIVLAALGYSKGADALLYPAVYTLALLGAFFLIQAFLGDIYAMITFRNGRGGGPDGLIPVLIGVVMMMVALPLMALIWGAKVTDLAELWARFIAGFQIGETRISPSDFLLFVLIFVVGYMVTRIVQGALRGSVLPKTRLDKGGQNAIVSGLGYVGIFLAALAAITVAGIDLSSLAIVAGALSVGVGFGLQTVVSNFVSGIILLIERPISEGDWIAVGEHTGIVKDISVRSTRIQTFDRTDVIVPNADLVSGVVTNWTRGNSVGRVIVQVGVAYGTDTRRVEELLRDIARDHPMVMLRPEPLILFTGFGASSLDFEIRAILRDINWGLTVGSEMRHEIARRFEEEGIEIPFPQQDLWLRNPETLKGDGFSTEKEVPAGDASSASAPLPRPAERPAGPTSPDEITGDSGSGETGEEGDGDGMS